MRLTADVLTRAEHYFNAYMDRELSLRGFKIPAIENLSILQDQYDSIDFSDNDIKRLDNFPKMSRLNALIFHNNSITRIGKNLGTNLTKLTTLVLTNNKIQSLSEIDNLASLKCVEILSLLENPVSLKPNYRLYVIHKIPSVKHLDFRKVQQKERDEAAVFFKSTVGKAFVSAVTQEGKMLAESRAGGAAGVSDGAAALVLTDEQKSLVKRAIENATTKEEIDIIERQLKAGDFSFILTAPKPSGEKEAEAEVEKEAGDDDEVSKKKRKRVDGGGTDANAGVDSSKTNSVQLAEASSAAPDSEQYDSMNVD